MPKILVIENEISVQKLAQANLIASGYQVLLAADGGKGLRLAQAEHPGLILLDLRMPGMSGWDVLVALKANRNIQGIPVIIMTASVRKQQKERALAMGAVGYLTKPFCIEELLRQVRQALGEGE